ncbi:MAG: putative lipid II flippase FtsW [Oscillospiraceae bacterium]|nr:putative lipid II flippase FtsW [Oscillospiraceae bacterium]
MAKTTEKLKKVQKVRGRFDAPFFAIVLILLTVGLVMLFSASYAYSYAKYGDSYKFIIRQAIFAAVGVVVMLIVSKIDYHFWRKLNWVTFFGTLALLVLLLALPPMVEGMDVKRWIVIGPVNFQPSEVAKFSIILLFASLISANQKLMKDMRFIGFLVLVLGLTCVLIMLEPHLSATVLVFAIGVVLLVAGGIPRWLIVSGAVGAVALFGLVLMTGIIGYSSDRITYWRDPWADPTGAGYQTIQSLLAIGSGGIFGRGIGQSRQKYLWVPEPHNDFIFSIVCEELGLLGGMVIILLFAFLVWRGFRIAMRAADKFGALLSLGLTFQVGLQAMLNIWVVTNTMPNTGISLPFFSYGGTSLLILLAEMGIVLSVSRNSNIEK